MTEIMSGDIILFIVAQGIF